MVMEKPKSSGLYWASTESMGRYELIVKVRGTSPFMTIGSAWTFSANTCQAIPEPGAILRWGPKLEIPPIQ